MSRPSAKQPSASQSVRVGVLIGSLRKASFSRKIANALIARAPDGMTCTIIEIGALPLYNQDLDDTPPQPWVDFRSALAECDALLFVTPEYNRSIPGCLKNATDIGSRPEGHNLFEGLPAAIVSVTPYALGAFGANHALRQSCVFLNLAVMQQPEAYIGKAADKLNDEGDVGDPDSGAFLTTFMTAFAGWIDRVSGPDPATFETFLADREQASNAYINGDPAPLLGMMTNNDPATFFPPSGERISGARAVARSDEEGARTFRSGSSGRFEVLASGASGRLAFWSGIQHADAHLAGEDGTVPMKLRTTEIFRFEGGGWKLAHRHADFIDKD